MGITNPWVPSIFKNVGAVLQSCVDIQESIEIGRRAFPADKEFMATLDKLQEDMDRKANIFYKALRELQGIEENTNERSSG